MSGHRLPLVTMTPFSVLKSSLGRPWVAVNGVTRSQKAVDGKIKFGKRGLKGLRTSRMSFLASLLYCSVSTTESVANRWLQGHHMTALHAIWRAQRNTPNDPACLRKTGLSGICR